MKVLNIKDFNYKIPKGAAYVGRAMPRYSLSASKWGNPFKIGKDAKGEYWSREDVIALYKAWMSKDNPSNMGLWKELPELRGKDLVCWCAPLPCHADVLLELANKCEEPHCFLPLGHEGLHQAVARIYDITEENE